MSLAVTFADRETIRHCLSIATQAPTSVNLQNWHFVVVTDAGTPGNNGIGWWSNNEGRYGKLPKDAYWGLGAGHQILLVVFFFAGGTQTNAGEENDGNAKEDFIEHG
jgi:hypothetical protein